MGTESVGADELVLMAFVGLVPSKTVDRRDVGDGGPNSTIGDPRATFVLARTSSSCGRHRKRRRHGSQDRT